MQARKSATWTWLALAVLGSCWAESPAPREEILSVKPLIVLVRNFASPDECQGVLRLLDRCHAGDWPHCRELRSRLHAGGSNRSSGDRKWPWRNSTSFTLELPGELDGALDSLVRRAHLLARHPITYGEGVQVASYEAGDYYEFHHDALMRRATVLLYLTDVAEGGETIFPLVRAPGIPADTPAPLPPAVTAREGEHLNFKVDRMEDMVPYCNSDFYLKVRPEAGTAILFFSYRPDYSLDEYAIHGACPVRSGRKAIFQRWMRFEENSLFAKAEESVRNARSLWGHDRLLPVPKAATSTTVTSTRIVDVAEEQEAHATEDTAHSRTAMLRSGMGQAPPEL